MLKVFPAGREEQFGCLSAKNVHSWGNSQVPWCQPRCLRSLNLRKVKSGRLSIKTVPFTSENQDWVSGMTFQTLLLAKAISCWESQCCYQIPAGLLTWIPAGVILRGCPGLGSLSRCFLYAKFAMNRDVDLAWGWCAALGSGFGRVWDLSCLVFSVPQNKEIFIFVAKAGFFFFLQYKIKASSLSVANTG